MVPMVTGVLATKLPMARSRYVVSPGSRSRSSSSRRVSRTLTVADPTSAAATAAAAVTSPSVDPASHRARTWPSAAGSTGLVRKSSIPAARQRSCSPSTAAAVIAMTGIRPDASWARISRVAV